MEQIQNHPLSNEEKTLIAMGAAVGAGCRTCADKLYEIATSLNIPKQEMLQAFLVGLDAKAKAVQTMQDKISALMNDAAVSPADLPERLAGMIRIASYAAANSAPDCLFEIQQAAKRAITDEQAGICIATAKMVRKNAMGFSDQDITDHFITPEANPRGVCCPDSGRGKSVSGCSCG